MVIKRDDFIAWFSELSNKNINIAGGKGASLAEMYRNKFPVPPGFVVTADSYRYFIDKSGIKADIARYLEELDVDNTLELNKVSRKIRDLMEGSKIPDDLRDEIFEAYSVLDDDKGKNAEGGAADILRTSHERPFVAVRSSATTEDLVDASFAGQQESFLSVKGNEELLNKIKKCFSSLYTPRAIYYRQKKGFDHAKSYLAVIVQKMIDSEKSGVIFSKNPLKDDGNVMIEAVYGLGEGIVSGRILPDHYLVNPKNNFEIVEEKISDKKIAIARNSSGNVGEVKLTEVKSKESVLNKYELKRLTQFALQLEGHYKKPQDIEFAIENGEFYIVQSRPITTKAKHNEKEIRGNVLFSGLGASPGVASGVVRIIENLDNLDKVKRGDILVTKMTNPDMVVAMQRASGIITDEGGVTSHAAIVSREMGIPAVVGTRVATEKLKNGEIVSVDGFAGRIIEGRAEEKKAEINPIVPTKTKIKVIVDLPDYAERAAKSGSKGIGLVRLESLIAESGRHPIYFLKKDKLNEYIELIHSGLKKMAMYFDEIWVRTSDVRSDEYKNLEGAPQREEGNPMLGDHGIRFSLKNQDLLESEFKAIKELADEFPDKKFGIMLPQIISVDEVKESKKILKKVAMPKNVKFGIMVETPASVQIINDLLEEGINFVSFGTNDLTQYTLAVDRNNPEVQNLYDEMHPAVLNSIKYVIRRCKKYNVESSICGQAGSKPEMAKFLVQVGIDSISVNADAAEKVSKVVAEIESGERVNGGKEVPKEIPKGDSNKKNIESEFKNDSEIKKFEINKEVNEEDAILKALEEDENNGYMPGFKKEGDVPQLNEAIPVSSADFVDEKKDDEINLWDDKNIEHKKLGIGNENSDEFVDKISEIDDLAEVALEAEIIDEITEKQGVDFTSGNEKRKIEKKNADELLDIF